MSDSPTLTDLHKYGPPTPFDVAGYQGMSRDVLPVTVADLLSALSSLSVEEREAAGISEHQWCEVHDAAKDPHWEHCPGWARLNTPCRMVSVLVWPKEAT